MVTVQYLLNSMVGVFILNKCHCCRVGFEDRLYVCKMLARSTLRSCKTKYHVQLFKREKRIYTKNKDLTFNRHQGLAFPRPLSCTHGGWCF